MAAGSIIATKFMVIAGSLYLSAMINGHPVHAILDTGAQVSVASPDLASRENLKKVGNASVSSDVGSSRQSLVGPATVRFAGSDVTVPQLIVADLSFVGQTGEPVDLIIGQDVLEHVHAHIDFINSTISYNISTPQKLLDQGYSRLDVSHDSLGRYVVNVSFGHGDRQEAVLDLGNNAPILMSSGLAHREGFDNISPRSTGLMATISGVSETDCFSIPEISIAGFAINDVPVDSLKDWRSAPYMNIGLPLLSNFLVDLDLGNHSVWVKPNRTINIEREMSGALFEYNSDHLKIVHIAKNSPAFESGLSIGDIITKVDGKKIGNDYYISGVWRWRLGPSGKTVSILVNGVNKNIHLRRYY